MKVLVVGSGGREHALVRKLAASPRVDKVVCAPGNGGMREAELAPVQAGDLPGLLALAKKEAIDLTVVGPEDPLCQGIVDLFAENGLRAFGPGRSGAALEGSKVEAKEFMARHGIPTAGFVVFDDPVKARLHLAVHPGPCVVKADGLAAGKGVFVCAGKEEALAAVDTIMEDKAFGPAGERILIEERLTGEEASFIVVTDGENILPFPSSQDHKAVFDGDKGPNTGGMGAYSPAPVLDAAMTGRVMAEVIRPTVAGLRGRGPRLPGLPLRRTDDHPGRAQGPGVQLPPGRPRGPAAPDAAKKRPGGDRGGRPGGPAGPSLGPVGGAGRGLRGHGRRGLPRLLRKRL